MPRNRKSKENTPQDAQSGIEISEEEQWRLINETGILKQPIPRPSAEDVEKEQDQTLADEIFSAITLIIPFTFCLLLFEMFVATQLNSHVLSLLTTKKLDTFPVREETDRWGAEREGSSQRPNFVRVYILQYKHTRKGQAFLFVLGCAAGYRLLWNLNKANWLVNMQQCPPFATVWVYTVVQLDLGPAILSLLACYGFMKWKGLSYSVRP
ncbi:hypothetical protein HWV62_36995 [Athelia sp. TMB]|nr:hypothetical protein HWV62_36995 [Athelia sp. TMB]